MKRTGIRRSANPLRRGKGLARGGELARHVGLRRSRLEPKPRKAVPGEDEFRATIRDRSGGWCELRLEFCAGQATEVHHRVTRKAGGRRRAGRRLLVRASNGIHVDAFCHGYVTGNPALSYEAGWMVREGQDPARVPVLLGMDMVFLADDGSRHSFEEVGT